MCDVFSRCQVVFFVQNVESEENIRLYQNRLPGAEVPMDLQK